jgi:hypothetical protein
MPIRAAALLAEKGSQAPMKSTLREGVTLIFDPPEQDTADVIGSACAKAVPIVQESWGLRLPADCRIYVMSSWWGFFFQSAPWAWRILLAVTIPFWGFRARRTWPYSAAWTQRYGRRVAIGLKPPRLLEQSDKSYSVRIFAEKADMETNLQHVTCHELVHACSAELRLPPWLNEGIAVVTVDRFLGKQTIQQESLGLLRDYQPKGSPPTYREMSRMSARAFPYHAVRGYWIVRYLEEVSPGFLRRMFSARRTPRAIEREVARQAGLAPESFWKEIDGVVVGHFERQRASV